MSPIDIVLLVLIGAAFVAVLVRAKRKGACGDCSSSGSCSGHCSSKQKSCCPAVKSVFAVGSEVLADTLVELGMVGEVLAIGNDLFPESVLALRRGIVNNLVYKDPFGMAQAALKRLLDFVLLGERPQSDVERGMVELVFRSNLDRYANAAHVQVTG